MFGDVSQAADGRRFDGIGMIDVTTQAGKKRFIGDVVVKTDIEGLTPTSLVGFENHSGRTFLGPNAKPLGRVLVGKGNNESDKAAGAIQAHIPRPYPPAS